MLDVDNSHLVKEKVTSSFRSAGGDVKEGGRCAEAGESERKEKVEEENREGRKGGEERSLREPRETPTAPLGVGAVPLWGGRVYFLAPTAPGSPS